MQTLEQKETERKTANLEQIQAAISRLEFKEGEGEYVITCSDDRMEKNGDNGRHAIFGGGAGALMEAYAAGYAKGIDVTTEENSKIILDCVLEVLGGIHKFCMHTDDDHGDGVAAGCGHVSNALSNPALYGITPEIAAVIRKQLEFLRDNGARYHVFHGKHDAQAALVLYGDEALAHSNGKGLKVFVYNADIAKALQHQSSEALSRGFTSGEFVLDEASALEAIKAAGKQQFETTYDKLAKGLPVYDVRREGDKLVASHHTDSE